MTTLIAMCILESNGIKVPVWCFIVALFFLVLNLILSIIKGIKGD